MRQRRFYIAHLITGFGAVIASEQVWTPDPMPEGYDPARDFSPEAVVEDALAFFNTDDHDVEPDGCTIRLFGPFVMGDPAASFAVEAETPGRNTLFPEYRLSAIAAAPAVTLDDVLRDWPANENSDDDARSWLIECHEALLRRVASGETIDYAPIALKNAQILELGDAVECGDDEAEHERDLLRVEVANLCKGLG